MPRGNYNVQVGTDLEAGKQLQRDSSYRACLHAMLIFIVICIILLVAAWPWNKHRPASDNSSNLTHPYSAAAKGDQDREPGLSSKPTTPTTTTARTTTHAIERKPLYSVIAVEETEPPRTTTASGRRTEPVESKKGLGITPRATTAQSDATTKIPDDDTDIIVHLPETTTTTKQPETEDDIPETTTTVAQHETVDDIDVVVYLPPSTTSTRPESTTETPGEETTEHDQTLLMQTTTPVDTISTTPADDGAATGEATEGSVGSPTTQYVTTETDFETEVFNASSVDNEDAQGHYESSSLPPIEGSGLVCDSSHCKALATRMLGLMNHSVEPCDDFYEHACGGLRSNPNLLGDDPSKDVYNRIRRGMDTIDDSSCQAHKTFKRYYESCVQYDARVTREQRIAEARRILDKVGVFNNNDNESPSLTDLTTLIIKLMQYHSTPLFDLMLDVDGHNPSKFALKLTAPVFKPMFRPSDRREDCYKGSDTVSDLNSIYHDYITCKKQDHETYLKEMNETIHILKIPISESTITEINQNMEFELLSLFEHLPSAGEMQQALTGKQYVDMTIGDLINDYPKVQWRILTTSLLKRDLPDNTHVQVYFKHYLHDMLGNFTQLHESKQQNVLLAYFAHSLYVDLVLTRDSCTREAYCLRVASDLMEETASSLYLSTFTRGALQDMRTDAQQVFAQLQSALERQLHDADWLDESSRSAAVSKLKNLTLTVDGGVGVFLNDSFLNERMKEISQRDTNYFTLSASLLKRYRRQMYSLYGANPSEPQAMWSHFLLPHSTQGIVVYALKNVVIPYGLMTRPMYEPDLPRYLLMARLGFVIAHEMAHHFDVIGMTYGPNGRGDHLLSYAPNATFRDKTNCLKDTTSFEGTKLADDGRAITFKANDSLSLNERIADRTAAVLGYETYLAWVRTHGEPAQLPYLGLTNNEVYFLAIAQIFCSKSSISDYGVSLFEDEHLPPFLRVNTIMDNSDEFTNVFQCKLGVDMNRNPDVKCEAFPKLTALDDTDFTPNDFY